MSDRKTLAKMVRECRAYLITDKNLGDTLHDRLESPFGFDRKTGVPRPIDALGQLSAEEHATALALRQWHTHLSGSAAGDTPAERARAATDELLYEVGATVLHRLAALRMAEVREVIPECIGKGLESAGFRLWLRLAGDAFHDLDTAYGEFLDRIYDELAADLPTVFDRRGPTSLLVPGPLARAKVIAALGRPELAPLWDQDDTLGWMFEEFNDPAERTKMREAADAPRNVRELAVRNQFFTPGWVVRFLTDNTLGRAWLERHPSSRVVPEFCEFLARTATPAARAAAPPADPRTLRVLDPACGSGHFLLYAFDLMEQLWLEAWDDDLAGVRAEFHGDSARFRAALPGLILRHNLHGIDIDPRCLLVAAMSLWLRAQKSLKHLRADARPRLTGLHLLCARPLTGSPDALDVYLARLDAPLPKLVKIVLAGIGETGILHRPDTAVRTAMAELRADWHRRQQQRQTKLGLFDDEPPRQLGLGEVVAAADDTVFFTDVDRALRGALHQLELDLAGDGLGDRARLVARDLRDGLDFLALSRTSFDVILMNPPFGQPTESTKAGLDHDFPNAGGDLFAMFFERTLELLTPGGRVGAITSRAWLALPSFEGLRTQVFGRLGTVEVGADFGYGVLNAKVETAAVTVRQGGDLDAPATWIRLVKTSQKESQLRAALVDGPVHPMVSVVPARRFETLPSHVVGYWMSPELTQIASAARTVADVADVRQGTATADDFRLLRLSWEVPAASVGLDRTFARFAKGVSFGPSSTTCTS